MKLRENVPLSSLTTMRLGGTARYVIDVYSLADVKEAYDFANTHPNSTNNHSNPANNPSISASSPLNPANQPALTPKMPLPTFPLGSGSNTIGRDDGFPGVIIINHLKGMEIIEETSDDVLVRAAGGEVWDDFVEFCTEKGYSGIEAMSGIPGTVGAAPVQNIGAYGQSLSQTIDNVEAYDTKKQEMVVLGRDELKMSYRETILNTTEKGRYFVTAVTLRLENDEYLEPPFYNSLQSYLDDHKITDYSPINIRNAVKSIRAKKLPDPAVEPNSGSFFKNIVLNSDAEIAAAKEKGLKVYEKSNGTHIINSGYLIEQAGLKGKELHGFKISDKAALILINTNAKSYHELNLARTEIIETVFKKFGYKLEQEPVEIEDTIRLSKNKSKIETNSNKNQLESEANHENA